MLIYAARLVLERSFGEDYRSQILKFWRGDWKLGEEAEGKWFKELYDKAQSAVVFVYGEAMKRDNFVHRNWMRSQQTLQDLRDVVKRLPGFTVRSPGEKPR